MTLSTTLDKSSPNNFELVFPLVPSETALSANDEFILNIHTTILPAVTMVTSERHWQNAKITEAGLLDFEQMNVSYYVDSQFKNWQLLFGWMSYINNNNDKKMEKRQDFVIDASLRIIDNFQSDILSLSFIGMYPVILSEVSMSYREGEIVLESNVTFNYDYYKIN